MEAVWRCRALVSWRTAGVFPFGGGDLSEWLRTDSPASGQVPRDYQLEILLTGDVLLCTTDEATAVAVAAVTSIDTVAGTVTMKSGVVVAARFYRREHLAEEARVVREERMITALGQREPAGNVGLVSHTKVAKDTKVGQKKVQECLPVCEVCGWGHDAGFSRVEIPGRAVIALHGLMAQIVGLVHAAQASGSGAVSTKDERLLAVCGGYRHPCKVFDDRKRGADYKVLFETRRRGYLRLKGS